MDTRNKHSFESHNEDPLRNRDVSYEPRDLGARGILVFLVVLFVSAVAIHLVVWGLYRVFTSQAQSRDPQLNPLAAGQRKSPTVNSVLQNTPAVNVNQFPEPRLQPDDTGDMEKFRYQEELILNSKPWKDQSGTVHIGIEDAMKHIAQSGLPARTGAPAQTSAVEQEVPMAQNDPGNTALQRDEQGAQPAHAAPQQ